MGGEPAALRARAVSGLAVAGRRDQAGRGRGQRRRRARDLVAVEARQAATPQPALGRLGAREVEPLGAVGGREDLVPVQFEERAERLAGVGVVFDEEDPGHDSTVSRAPSDRPRLDSANERMVLTRAHRPRRRLSMTSKAPTALAVALALAVGGVMPATAQGPIRIGASLSLTGTYAKLGKNQHEGYQLCEKEVNGKGGLLGRKVQFVVYDDQSLPATAVRLYEKLITEDKVDAIMGPYSSPVTEAAVNVTEKYKKVMVAPLAATTSIFKKGRKYIFMIVSPAEVYLEGLIDLAAKRGLKSIALTYEDTLFAKAAAVGAAELARSKGMRVVFQEPYPKGTTDFAALLTKIKALDPDVFAAATYFDDAVAVTRQMKELDVNPKMLGLTVGGDLPEFYDLLKQNAEYVYGASQWEPHLPYPGLCELVEAYKKEIGREPVYHAASVYGGCLVFAEAVRRAGTLDTDRLRDVLLKLEMRTPFGDYKVDADGFQIGHKMVMSQWQDGRQVIVWPEDLATGKPRFPTPSWSQR